MTNPDSYCWYDGVLTADNQACITIADRGFLLGDGLFETIWIKQGVPIFWHRHIERLRISADYLALPIAEEADAILAALMVVLERNNITEYGSARITLTRGEGPRGIAPPAPKLTQSKLLITAVSGQAPIETPLSYIISKTRRNEGSFASQMKMLSYADNILARQEAVVLQADEAIMLNNKDILTCGTIGNIFQLQGGCLATPAVECGVLPGIVRSHILGNAVELGLTVTESEMPLSELDNGVWFLSNSLVGLRGLYSSNMPFEPDEETMRSLKALRVSYKNTVTQDIDQFKAEQSA